MQAFPRLTAATILLATASAILPVRPVAAAEFPTITVPLYPANPAMAVCVLTAQAGQDL